jgi:hypothetical protein
METGTIENPAAAVLAVAPERCIGRAGALFPVGTLTLPRLIPPDFNLRVKQKITKRTRFSFHRDPVPQRFASIPYQTSEKNEPEFPSRPPSAPPQVQPGNTTIFLPTNISPQLSRALISRPPTSSPRLRQNPRGAYSQGNTCKPSPPLNNVL